MKTLFSEMTETLVYGNTWLVNTIIIFILNKYVEIKVTWM